jgi:hypothetical protein
MRSRSLRVAGIAALSACALSAQVSFSDEPAPGQISGTVEAIDPLVGFEWAPPVDDGEVAALASDGATVTEEPCAFGDRPGVLERQIFRRPIRTTGHLVVAPSGNVTLVCHAAAGAGAFERPLPTSAIVVDGAPCFFPHGRRTNDSHLVVAPSLHVHLVCHVSPAP